MTLVTAAEVREFLLRRFEANLAAVATGADVVGEQLDLLQAGIVDSLGVIEMIGAVENHFKIKVDFAALDPEQLTIVGPFSRYVAEHAVRAAGAS